MFKTLLDLLFGGGISTAGNAVTNVAKWASLAALVPALWHWYEQHGGDVAVTFTWSHVVFIAALVFALITIAHRSDPHSGV